MTMKTTLEQLTLQMVWVMLGGLLVTSSCHSGEPHYDAVMRTRVEAQGYQFRYYYGGGKVYYPESGDNVPFTIVENDEEFEREPFTAIFPRVMAKIDSVELVKPYYGGQSVVKVWRKTDSCSLSDNHFYNIRSWSRKPYGVSPSWYFVVPSQDVLGWQDSRFSYRKHSSRTLIPQLTPTLYFVVKWCT